MCIRLRARSLLAVVGVAAVIALLLAGPAQAHTELVYWQVESGPAAGQHRLLLRFSEPIDGRFLTVSVLDLQGNIVESGSPSVDQERRTDGYVELGGLQAGVYSVAWWTRALDGDPSTGSFILGLETQATPTALLPPVGARDPATQPAMLWHGTVWNTALHWLIYLGAALLLGGLAFALIAWRPVWTRQVRRPHDDGAGAPEADAPGLDRIDRDASRTYRLLALSGAGLFLLANLMLLVMQVGSVRYSLLQPVTSAAPTALGPSTLSHEAPYKALGDILSGYNGQVWLARMGIGMLALVLAILPTSRTRTQNWRWLLAFVAGLAAALTVSLSSHAAVVPQAGWARFLDWAHIVVMGVWIGGLLALLLTLRRIRREGEAWTARLGPAVASRFSNLALGAFLFMAATGIVEAFLQVGRPSLLLPTLYGQALVVKLALFAVLFVFGALHRRFTLPQLGRAAASGRAAERRMAVVRALPFEFAVGASLLLAVALMASLGTSKAVWPAHQSLGYYSSVSTQGVSAVLRAVPGKAGENALALDVTDRRLGPVTMGGSVTLTLNGRSVALQPDQPLTAGTTQRFSSPALVLLQETTGPARFAYERPSYAVVQGTAPLHIPAAGGTER